MDSNVLVHLPEALVRAIEHAEVRRTEPRIVAAPQTAPKLSIALSREVGTRATEVAQEVAQRLGWKAYDHALLERLAKEMKVRVGLLESVDERHIGWLQEALEQFSLDRRASESSYVLHLVQTVAALAAHGHCVIVGRGAAMFLPSNATLRVRLIAPREYRIVQMAERRKCSEEEAERYLEKTDRERNHFIKDHFHKDPTDPQNYDLVINASRTGVTNAAELIVLALGRIESSLGQRLEA